MIASANISGSTFTQKLKLIFFWFWPPRRERASGKVTILCQKDPDKGITRTSPPGFSLLVVKPYFAQPASFQGLFSPCPRPPHASGTLSCEPSQVSCHSRRQGSFYIWCHPWAHSMGHFSWAEFTALSFPNSLLITRHTACTISHPTNNPTARGYSPVGQMSQPRNKSNWMTGSWSHRNSDLIFLALMLTLYASLPPCTARRKSMNSCRYTRSHISTPWQILPIIHMLHLSSQMFGWGTPKG